MSNFEGHRRWIALPASVGPLCVGENEMQQTFEALRSQSYYCSFIIIATMAQTLTSSPLLSCSLIVPRRWEDLLLLL